MLMIRLQRMGKHKKPTYRLIINEKHKDTKGDSLEILGNYNPHSKEFVCKEDRIKYWISVGAQCSATVHNLLINKKVITGDKKLSWKPKKKELTEEEKKAEAAKLAPKAEAKPAEEKKEEVKEEKKEEPAKEEEKK